MAHVQANVIIQFQGNFSKTAGSVTMRAQRINFLLLMVLAWTPVLQAASKILSYIFVTLVKILCALFAVFH